jgi:hypothetical protein
MNRFENIEFYTQLIQRCIRVIQESAKILSHKHFYKDLPIRMTEHAQAHGGCYFFAKQYPPATNYENILFTEKERTERYWR